MVAAPAQPIPLHADKLYIGIDVARERHVAAFYSNFLRRKHGHYHASPTINIENSRLDFERLVTTMQFYVPLDQCIVVMEKTGHYHLALLQYLQEHGVTVYLLHVQKRPKGQKNDRRDAQRLANTGFTQIELGVQPDSPDQELHRHVPVSETAQILHGLTQYRTDVSKQIVRARNQLTAIADILFPEFSQIFKDVNNATACAFRERFPTPADLAAASGDDLKACRIWRYPGNKALEQLQCLARQSIGLKESGRVRALVLEQTLLIKQLRVLEENEEAVKQEIATIVEQSREGQIITSLGDFVGFTAAGEIIAAIGCIKNFETPGKFKGFTGWMPVEDQTGKSRSGMVLSKGGNRMLRHTMYLVGMRAIKGNTEWRDIYSRLVERQCPYDAKKKRRTGRRRPLSRIIGQISSMIYEFLKKDAEVIAKTPPGEAPPKPALYNRAIHYAHIEKRRSRGGT